MELKLSHWFLYPCGFAGVSFLSLLLRPFSGLREATNQPLKGSPFGAL